MRVALALSTSHISAQPPEIVREALQQILAEVGPLRLLAFDADVHFDQEVSDFEDIPTPLLTARRHRAEQLYKVTERLGDDEPDALIIVSEMTAALPEHTPRSRVLCLSYESYVPQGPWGELLSLDQLPLIDLAVTLPRLPMAGERGRELLYPPAGAVCRNGVEPERRNPRAADLLRAVLVPDLSPEEAEARSEEALAILRRSLARTNSFYATLRESCALEALDALALRGFPVPRDTIGERLRRAGVHGPNDLLLLRLPGLALSEDELARLAAPEHAHPRVLATAVAHPSAGPELWRRLCEEGRLDTADYRSPGQIALQVLARGSEMRKVPDVMERILAYGDVSTLAAATEDAEPTLFRELVVRMLQRDPEGAGRHVTRVLDRARREQQDALSDADLLPLLTHPDSQVRLRTMTSRFRGRDLGSAAAAQKGASPAPAAKVVRMTADEVLALMREQDSKDVARRVPYLNHSCFDRYQDEYVFFIALKQEAIVGCAMLAPSPGRGERWVCSRFVGVDPEHREQGIARALKEAMFRYCADRDLSLSTSTYTEMGGERLKAMNRALAEEFGVEFLDADMEKEQDLQRALGRPLTTEERRSTHLRC